tara:strand:- start:164307 stop:168755 length:4449 start_codon:yes stop_codon:yes gene_type:complete
LGLLILLLVSGVLLSLPFVQTKLGQYVTEALNEEFGTNLSIEKVAISPFGNLKLKNIVAKDKKNNNLFKINKLQTSILQVGKLINNGHPYLKNLIVDGLQFNIIQYKGDKETNLDDFIASFDDGSPSSGKFRMFVNNMKISNSSFSYTDYNLETPKLLYFTNLNGELDQFAIKGSNVTTSIKSLAFKDHRGVEITNLVSKFTYSKTNIILDTLALKTVNSNFEGNVKLLYKREDFKDFNNKVVFDVQIDKATISTNDLNYFYNEFGPNNTFYVDTHLKGTLNNFTTNNLSLVDKYGSEIKGNVTFKNLLTKKEKEFEISGNFNKIYSRYDDIKTLMPRMLGERLPSSLALLGSFDINGTMDLTYNDIDADVIMLSELGYLKSKLYINNLNNIDKAEYNGNIVLNRFDIGTLIGDNTIGKTTLNLDVDGKGFTKEYLDTKVIGYVESLTYDGYTYQKIEIDGKLKMPYFQGYFNSNDKNLKMDFNGIVDLSSKSKNYNFKANIDYANLRALNIYTKDSISIIKGLVDINATGNSIDEVYGTINLKNLYYQNNNDFYFFDDFILESTFDADRERTITVESPDIVSGKVVGKFKFNQLQKLLENAAGSLYANYSPNKLLPNQYMTFDFTIYNKIIGAILPNVEVGENTRVKGKIISDEEFFTLDFKSPSVSIDKNKFSGITIDIDNKNPLYNAYISLDSLHTDFYDISEFNLINITQNDTLFFRTEFKGGKEKEDNYDLNLYHTINQDKNSVIGFKNSQINFKNSLWYINEGEDSKNKIVFDKKLENFDFQKLLFSNNDESFSFEGVIKGKDYKDLNLKFNNVDLDKVTPALNNLTFAGRMNGIIDFKQDKDVYKPISDVRIDSLQINDYDVGDLKLQITSDEYFRKFNVNSTIIRDDFESFYTKGTIEIINKEALLSLDTKFEDFDIKPLGPLLSSVFSDMRGLATGRASVTGKANDPEIDGIIYLDNAGMNIPYLNVDFNLEDRSRIDVTENQFLFRSFEITDTKYNTKGIISGNVKHKNLDNWVLDLNLSSRNILALDTKEKEDEYYYGTAFLNGTATIKGPVEALKINVAGKSERGTSIKIPVKDTENYGEVSYINIIKVGEEKIIKQKIKDLGGLDLVLDFDITPDAEIEVILNQETGHAMKGRGGGGMYMHINTNGTFTMNGDFTIHEGEYNFKYGGIISKKLAVKKYGTIVWEGDPMNATLNLEAVYHTQTNPSVLLESSSISNRKVDTDVVIKITGNLENPETDFSLEYPNVSSVYKSEILYKLSDKDTRQQQALSVLAGGTYFAQGAVASDYYSNALSETASSLLQDIISNEDDKIKFGLGYTTGSRINNTSDQVGVNLSSQINDKLSINGKVGVPVGGISQSGVVGNVELQYQLNEDNTLRARAFNKENDISYIGQGIGYTQGIGLSYNVDFDNMSELWRKVFAPKTLKEKDEKNPYDEIPPDSDLDPEYINITTVQDKNKKKEQEKEEKAPEIE